MRGATLEVLNLEPILQSAFGSHELFQMDPGLSVPEAAFSDVGDDVSNKPDPTSAKQLLAEAGYGGLPIRFLSTREHTWRYNMALPISQQ